VQGARNGFTALVLGSWVAEDSYQRQTRGTDNSAVMPNAGFLGMTALVGLEYAREVPFQWP
jgi:hypothetical protein